MKRSGAVNTTPSSNVTLKLATRASVPRVSTTTRTLLANKVVVTAETRLRRAAMSPSNLSYSTGGAGEPPSGSSLASGFKGEPLSSVLEAGLGGAGPKSSEAPAPVLGAASGLGSGLSLSALAAAARSSGSLARLGWANATNDSKSSGAATKAYRMRMARATLSRAGLGMKRTQLAKKPANQP